LSAQWSEIREKHRALWTRSAAQSATEKPSNEGPIIGDKRINAFLIGGVSLEKIDRPIEPGDIDTDIAVRWAEDQFQSGDGFLDGELVWGAPPVPGIPWSEAILGCPVYQSEESRSLWAGSWLENWDEMERVLPLSDNAWFLKLMDLSEAFVKNADGRYPVTQTVLKGPSEIMTAMRGYEQLCLDFYDSPEQVHKLASFCTDIWIETAQALFEIIPPFDGGYAAPRLEIWAPGQLIRFEEDATIFFSSETYREFIREYDCRIASSFEYSLMHTHSGDCKFIEDLLDMEELPAIQVTIDPNGPPYTELIPLLKRTQEAGKALIVTHELEKKDVDVLAEELYPSGLALERMISI